MKHHLFIGLDRSDASVDVCLLDASASVLSQSKIPSGPEALMAWAREIRKTLPEGASAAICIEQPCQNLVHFFRQFDFLSLYLVNPAVIKKYRESLSASRAKDDRRDAHALALFVLERHARLEPWASHDPLADQIALLAEKRRQLVDVRTNLTNRLTQALKEVFPQALELSGRDLHAPLARDFLMKWPNLQALQKAKSSTIKQFYYARQCRRPKVVEKRLAMIRDAVPMCTDESILETYTLLIHSLVSQIAATQNSILRFESLIEQKLAEHPDAVLFRSLPGAGATFSARLLSFFGSDRSKYDSAAAVQQDSGVAPLTKQSGKMRFVHRRYACNKFSRQSFIEWAGQTVGKSTWAKAFYLHQKAKGHRHHSILRSLAYKWQRILFRCWQDSRIYDEARYIEALKAASSPLVPIINQLLKTTGENCEKLEKITC